MDFKKLLKRLNLSENYGSTILGFIVVLILGSFIFNVFKGDNQEGEVSEEGTSTEESGEIPAEGKKHTVAAGEDLWKISEQYYNTGYNWVDIAKANNITDPNTIEEGQELTIPRVTPILPTAGATTTPVATATEAVVPTNIPTKAPTITATVTPVEDAATPTIAQTATPTGVSPTTTPRTSPSQGSYTVKAGDNLWKIAVAQYNNGYRWIDIARANKLDKPDVIHAGNVLTLP